MNNVRLYGTLRRTNPLTIQPRDPSDLVPWYLPGQTGLCGLAKVQIHITDVKLVMQVGL